MNRIRWTLWMGILASTLALHGCGSETPASSDASPPDASTDGDACVGDCSCEDDDDCQEVPWGDWSACDCTDANNTCNTAGTQSRARNPYVCVDAACVPSNADVEEQSCSCETEHDECFVSIVVAGDCNFGACEAGECVKHECEPGMVCNNEERTCIQCFSHFHCHDHPGGPACDTSTNECVACTDDTHCGGATPGCNTAANECVACTDDTHCGGATPRCNAATNKCVECLTTDDCSAGEGCCTWGDDPFACRADGELCGPIVIPTVISPTISPTINPTILPQPVVIAP